MTMRSLLKTVVAGAAAMGALLGAKTAMAANGVVFIHGTSDQSSTSAMSGYWSQSSVDAMRGGRQYLVVGYQGASCAGFDSCSWGSVIDQVGAWATANNITDIVVVTHSNGNAPVRYAMGHTGAVTPGGRTVSSVTGMFRKIIFQAGDHTGTPLADKVTTSGSLAAIGNAIVGFFGGGNYNSPAVWAQRTDRMRNTYNVNGTYAGTAGSTTIGGVTVNNIRGTDVYAAIWSGDAWCGGYGTTVALKAAKLYAGFPGGCGDGFIGCDSSGYLGNIVVSDSRLNHNQSRRSCHGSGSATQSQINNTIGYTVPADYTIAPAAQACNATTSAWATDPSTGYNNYFQGCPASWRGDGYVDYDCYTAYGGDEAAVAPDNYTSTAYASYSCPDSWLGDGYCDMCLVAKYGYDGASGSTGADDCVNNGPGTTTLCTDVGTYSPSSYYATGTYIYRASH